MRYLLLILALLVPTAALAQGAVPTFYLGANGAWYDENTLPSDFEVGGGAALSLSPHISGVGSAYYGINHSYLRGAVGIRLTATDVEDKNFSIGVGIQYQASSEPEIRPEEWAPDVSIGWKPLPDDRPALVLGAQASYGLTSKEAALLAGVRWAVGGAK